MIRIVYKELLAGISVSNVEAWNRYFLKKCIKTKRFGIGLDAVVYDTRKIQFTDVIRRYQACPVSYTQGTYFLL